MSFRILILVICLFTGFQGWTQLNSYKYVIVPKRFETFKSVNQHNTSVLIKYLLSNEGFNVVYDDAQPLELRTDPCLGLKTKLNNTSSLLSTRVVIDLVNCREELVFTTREGKSKKKDYKEAFAEAIEEAFTTFNGIQYNYQPKSNTSVSESSSQTPQGDIPEAIEVSADPKPRMEEKTVVVSGAPVPEPPANQAEEVWYAQETPTGFQLVDSSPSIRMQLLRTTLKEVFIGRKEQLTGIVFKEDDQWWFEYYEGTDKKRSKLNIKF